MEGDKVFHKLSIFLQVYKGHPELNSCLGVTNTTPKVLQPKIKGEGLGFGFSLTS